MFLIVAIRFRWIWVGRTFIKSFAFSIDSRNPLSLDMGWKGPSALSYEEFIWSQSAFAGYGLEVTYMINRGALAFGRNPLSLDMGWKTNIKYVTHQANTSQSAFAGYGLEVSGVVCKRRNFQLSQSAFAGYGLEAKII